MHRIPAPSRCLLGAALLAATSALRASDALVLEDMVTLFGADHVESRDATGRRTFTWEYRGAHIAMRPTDPRPNPAQGGGLASALPALVTGRCRLSIVVDPGGEVRELSARGAACPVVLGDPRRWQDGWY